MKNLRFRKGICLGLIAAMTVSLCACGGKKNQNGGGSSSADASLAKQYVYSNQEIPLDDLKADSLNFRNIMAIDDRVYLLAEMYSWSETSSSSELKLVSMKTDGTDSKTIALQVPASEGGTAPEGGDASEGGTSEGGNTSEGSTSSAGSMARTAQTLDATADVAVDVDEKYDEGPQFYESTSYGSSSISKAGLVYAISTYYYEDYTNPENGTSINTNTLCCWDMEGNLKWQLPVDEEQDPETYVYINSLIPMSDGSLGIIYSGDSYQKAFVDAEGNLGAKQEITGDAGTAMMNANYTIVKDDGTVMLMYYDDSWQHLFIANYDIKTDALTEGVQIPDSMTWSGFNTVAAGVNTDIVFANSTGIYTYNVGDAEPVQMMSYINSDLLVDNLSQITMLDETHFVGCYYAADSNVASIFTKVNPEDIQDKKVLTLAGMWINSDIKTRVVEFNKASQEYRIVVKEYDSYNTAEDYTAGLTKLNNDIISGQMPDILSINSNMPVERFASKGLLADINKLIEADEELSKVEFMQNVFDTFSNDGKLYQVIPTFNIQTYLAKKAIVGDRESWTMQEMQELMATLPEETMAFGEMTRDGFMSTLMMYSGNDFVDVSTGKCNFNSPEFLNMLEYAKSLPEEYNYDEDYDWTQYESQYREDRTVLMPCYISNIRDMNSYINGSFGEPVTFIGFPTENGKGSIISVDTSYAISASSANQDVAWDFVRYYLTDEYQSTLEWGLPIVKSTFMANAQKALEKPYYLDENGEKVEYSDYAYINGESIELDPMTQEQIDQVVAAVESATKKYYYNDSVLNIINEEAAAFFQGQKSASDVAQIIQSRAQIYVDENS